MFLDRAVGFAMHALAGMAKTWGLGQRRMRVCYATDYATDVRGDDTCCEADEVTNGRRGSRSCRGEGEGGPRRCRRWV